MGDTETKPVIVVVTREVKYVGAPDHVERQVEKSLAEGYRLVSGDLIISVRDVGREEFARYTGLDKLKLGPIVDDGVKLDRTYVGGNLPPTQPATYDAALAENLAFREHVTRLHRALAFAASVIKSGEPWTQTCDEVIGGALRGVQ